MTDNSTRDEIELFLQGEGIPDIMLVQVARHGTVQDVIQAARAHGLSAPEGVEVFIFLEDAAESLAPGSTLEAAGIGHRGRVHVHRCRQVEVTVNFNADQKTESFPPSATVARVMEWAVSKRGFNLTDVDATEHALQVCGTTDRPDEDIHIGTLVQVSTCGLCFDLVAKQRVEG